MSLYARILVPLDGSLTSDRGLQEAIHLASELKSKLRPLHVSWTVAPRPTAACRKPFI